MSSAAQLAAHEQRTLAALDRAAYRTRLTKILCGLAIAACFWFSVPYQLPYIITTDSALAAANQATAYEGSLSRQIALPIIGIIAMFLLWRFPKRGRLGGPLIFIAAAYVSWAIVSLSWSTEPATTLKRLVVFVINIFFAYTVARIFSVVEMALLGFMATASVALLALFSHLVLQGNFAPRDPDFRFTGVTTANYQAMSLLVCIFCALTLLDRRPKWLRWIAPTVLFLLYLLYITRSRLSTIICILMLVIMFTRFARKHIAAQYRALMLIAGLTIVLPAMTYILFANGGRAAQAAFMMGRTDTQNTANLSNRAPLWAELWGSAVTHPITGFGYDAFWTPDRVERISADQGWAVPHAHDSYLDQFLSLGIVGCFLYTTMLLTAVTLAWKRYRRTGSAEALLPAVLLTWLMLEGIAESVPVDPYLPSILAYACIVKMSLIKNTEAEDDIWRGPEEIVSGLTPLSLRELPPYTRDEAAALLGGRRA